MKLFSMAAMALPCSAIALKDNVYKNVRSLIGTKPTLIGGAYTETLSSQNGQLELEENALTSRDLQEDPLTIRCFWECVNQNMTAEQCEAYIRSVLGDDLSYHEIQQLKIKINRPRSPTALATSYFMVGIPVNIYGEVDCSIDNGIISYPWEWEAEGGSSFSIPDVPCIGLNGAECCDKLMTAYEEAGIPLKDKNGNCLSCWVHQEPLEPIIDPSGSGATLYIEHQSTASSTCDAFNLSVAQVDEADLSLQNAIQQVLPAMQFYLDSGASCEDLLQLQRILLLFGRALPKVMSRIPQMLCGHCEEGLIGYNGSLPDALEQDMLWIMKYIVEVWSSSENCIIIYTDHKGLVMEPPLIGGSRAGLDWDRIDPDCKEESNPIDEPPPTAGDETPGDGPPPTAGDETPGDGPPPTAGDETPGDGPPPTAGDETPGDGPPPTAGDGSPSGSCTSVTMASSSESEGEDCYPCRNCLLKNCDWDHSTRCRKLLKHKRKSTPDDWLACLESNGFDENYVIPDDPDKEHWCACTTICQEECALGGPPPVPMCDYDQVANESANSLNSCFGCRNCLKSKCMKNGWLEECKLLLTGKVSGVGKGSEFMACVATLGASTTGESGTMDIDFSPSSCAKKCRDDCEYDAKPVPGVKDCLPNKMTEQAVGGTCDTCRTCLMNECSDEWSVEGKHPKCLKMLNGKKKDGTDLEWVSCLESDGDSVKGGVGGGWSYFAECAQNCESSCQETEPPAAPDMCTYSDIALLSSGKHSPCSSCRTCLKKKCAKNWGIVSSCTQLIDGDKQGSPEQFTACLESNGEFDEGGSGATSIDFASSVQCVSDCEASCEYENPPEFTDVDEESCMPYKMEAEGQKGQCSMCSDCLNEKCSEKWASTENVVGRCLKLLSKKKVGNFVEWVSCLQSGGTSRFNADFETNEGSSLWETFDECSQDCLQECDSNPPQTNDAPIGPPMCDASDLADLSDSKKEPCFKCRTCMKNKCNQWTGDCAAILKGMKASSDEWAHCIENCGGGLGTTRHAALRALSSGPVFDPDDRTTWCGCSRKCDDKCILPE